MKKLIFAMIASVMSFSAVTHADEISARPQMTQGEAAQFCREKGSRLYTRDELFVLQHQYIEGEIGLSYGEFWASNVTDFGRGQTDADLLMIFDGGCALGLQATWDKADVRCVGEMANDHFRKPLY